MLKITQSTGAGNMAETRPYKYSESPRGRANNPAYLSTYKLATGDWFEVGEAYSLHLTEKSAKALEPGMGWCKNSGVREVFVCKSVLEAIVKSKKRPKHVFSSWEN